MHAEGIVDCADGGRLAHLAGVTPTPHPPQLVFNNSKVISVTVGADMYRRGTDSKGQRV